MQGREGKDKGGKEEGRPGSAAVQGWEGKDRGGKEEGRLGLAALAGSSVASGEVALGGGRKRGLVVEVVSGGEG